MALTDDERFWLQTKWSDTRNALLKATLAESLPVIDEIIATGEISEKTWKSFIKRSALGLDRARKGCESRGSNSQYPRAEMYALAISLLGDTAPMQRTLLAAKDFLGNENQLGVTGVCFKRGFHLMRAKLRSTIKGHALSIAPLRAISNRLDKDSNAPDFDDPAHYAAIVSEIVNLYPGLANSVRTVASVKALFLEFGYLSEIFDEEPMTDGDFETMPDIERGLAYLEECAGELPDLQALIFDFRMEEGEQTAVEFCVANGIDRNHYNRQRVNMEKQIADCVSKKFETRERTSL